VAVAGEILVKFKPGSQGLRTLGTTTALESLGDSTFGTLARIQVPKGQEESYILSYRALPEVEYAEPNYWVPNPGRETVAALAEPRVALASSRKGMRRG
jgi:hypothetical protein